MAPLEPPPALHPHDSAVRLRHDHRASSASSDWELVLRLRAVATDRLGATRIVTSVCELAAVPTPRLGFHARRRPDTGHARPPARVVEALGIGAVDPRRYPPQGHLQLSATPTLGAIAHELGHHLVFHLDPPGTPAHGLRWVARQDEAATRVAAAVGW